MPDCEQAIYAMKLLWCVWMPAWSHTSNAVHDARSFRTPIGSSCCSTSGPARDCLGFSQGQGTNVRVEQSCWLGQCTSLGAQLTWLIQYQISSTQAGHNGTLENQYEIMACLQAISVHYLFCMAPSQISAELPKKHPRY